MPESTQQLLKSFHILWTSDIDDEIWKRVSALGDSDDPVANDQSQWMHVGPTLSSHQPAWVHSLVANRDENAKPPSIFWGFTARRRPEGEPPKEVREADARAGGTLGLSTLLSEVIASSTKRPIGIMTADLTFPEGDWACLALAGLPKGDMGPIGEFGENIRTEQIGYRFDNGVLGLSEISITYFHDAAEYRVKTRARAPVELSESLEAPLAHQLSELLSTRLFSRREERSNG